MATTITPSDLSVSINDSITLNSNSYGGTSSFVANGCTAADQRVVSVAIKSTSETLTWTDLFWYKTTNAQGQAIATEFQYLRVTNLDTVNYILLNLESQTANNSVTIKLGAGESFNLQNGKMLSSTTEIRTSYPTLVDIEYVKAAADTAAVDVEIMTILAPAT
tara:strand:- start:359 stop:847 length:489 start_codon:yes stop_codon:yes gene_type:complete